MTIQDILLIGVGLAMDAFAVSVCKGLASSRPDPGKAMIIGCWFALFQMAMPLVGWAAGNAFSNLVAGVAPWIAFVLLALIGGQMIRESLHPEESPDTGDVSFRVMLPLAVATSIDALVTGVTFAFLSVNIWTAISLIGAVTFLFCLAGFFLGRLLGSRLEKHARLLGGVVLVLIGVKILLEHLIGRG